MCASVVLRGAFSVHADLLKKMYFHVRVYATHILGMKTATGMREKGRLLGQARRLSRHLWVGQMWGQRVGFHSPTKAGRLVCVLYLHLSPSQLFSICPPPSFYICYLTLRYAGNSASLLPGSWDACSLLSLIPSHTLSFCSPLHTGSNSKNTQKFKRILQI